MRRRSSSCADISRPARSRICALLSCAATAACCRSRAWAKISARSWRRAVSRSDHSRPSRAVPITRHPSTVPPPPPSGTTVIDPVPRSRSVWRSTTASSGRSVSRARWTTSPWRSRAASQGPWIARITAGRAGTPSRVHDCASRASSLRSSSVRSVAQSTPRPSPINWSPRRMVSSVSVGALAANRAARSERSVSNRKRSARLCWARRRWARCTSSPPMSPPWRSSAARPPSTMTRCCSHSEGTRKRTMLLAGSPRTSSPQRSIWRASNMGTLVPMFVGAGRSPASI